MLRLGAVAVLDTHSLSLSHAEPLRPPSSVVSQFHRAIPHRWRSQSCCIATNFSTSFSSTAMALQLLPAFTHLPTFNGLKAAPSVRQVNKLSGLGCVKRTSASQSIKAVINPMDDPILKEAMKEPIAFLGGVFAGLLRLDLNEEPLKDWVAKTAEAAGMDLDDSQAADMDDSVPEDIRID